MENVGIWAVVALVGYLLGSISVAYFLVKHFTRKNILEWGTGNVGTLNVYRATNSKLLTVMTLVGDMLKAVVAITAGVYLARGAGLDQDVGAAVGGIFAIVGHNYPVFLRFRGGKGIASSVPMGIYFAPELVGLFCLAFLLTAALTRLLVVGQIVATAVVPIIAYFLFPEAAIPS